MRVGKNDYWKGHRASLTMMKPLCEQETLSRLSEWRTDPLTGRCVRLAVARSERPSDFAADDPSHGGAKADCPFCAGAEESTPHEIDRIADSQGSWLGRVVPNRYPAVEGADGIQEVILESPDHKTRFTDLTPAEATAAVTLWIRRLVHWQRDGEFDYVLLFKNEGAAAGASLAHAHTQLITLAEVPPVIREEWQRSSAEPLMVPQECLIASEEGFTLFCPPAPRFAGESWILPPSEGVSLKRLLESPEQISRLAALLQRLIAKVTTLACKPDYNLVFQVPTASAPSEVAGQWRIEVIPRNSTYAGFELTTGLGVNAVAPEAAAKQLRAVWNEK